jgi:2-hydroxychromene-2-carboxylate isomerase
MTNTHAHFYFDFVDPGSYLLHLMLEEIGVPGDSLSLIGMELAIGPDEMIDPGAPQWQSYCDVVDQLAAEAGHLLPRVDFVPWTRKAHELAIHATQSGVGVSIRDALFRAHFHDRHDLGRIDVLTDIARGVGLDHTETKAVLDVDRYTETLTAQRAAALDEGIVRVPTICRGAERLVGPAGIHDLRILFESPGGPTAGT